jgi:hypothetical protein
LRFPCLSPLRFHKNLCNKCDVIDKTLSSTNWRLGSPAAIKCLSVCAPINQKYVKPSAQTQTRTYSYTIKNMCEQITVKKFLKLVEPFVQYKGEVCARGTLFQEFFPVFFSAKKGMDLSHSPNTPFFILFIIVITSFFFFSLAGLLPFAFLKLFNSASKLFQKKNLVPCFSVLLHFLMKKGLFPFSEHFYDDDFKKTLTKNEFLTSGF